MDKLMIERWNDVYVRAKTPASLVRGLRKLSNETGFSLVSEASTWDGNVVRTYVFDDRSGFFGSIQKNLEQPVLTKAVEELWTAEAFIESALSDYKVPAAPYVRYLRPGYYFWMNIQQMNYSERT
jgi:hypothetical protein